MTSTRMRHFLVMISIFEIFEVANGHAIFWQPPSRASLGKHSNNFCNVPINHNHMSLYCGGITVQHKKNGGKCGVCGDAFHLPQNRKPHEVPGKYATGTIGKSYFVPGQYINVTIDVVANHLGFFGFMLCPNNNPKKDPDQNCFNQYPLPFDNGKYLFHVHRSTQKGERFVLKLKLPDGLRCWQCILQWTYVAGNNWGKGAQMADYHTDDCLHLQTDGKVGCGPQETFRGCADICIGEKCPRARCQKAKPFDIFTTDVPPTTDEPEVTTSVNVPETTAPITQPSPAITTPEPEVIPELPDQECIESGVKEPFAHILTNFYCQWACQNKPMESCNLFLCWCNTKYFVEH